MRDKSPGVAPCLAAEPFERLDSWKEIAAFFRRDVRTVQLWEHREGLPVYRHCHNKQSSVYSFRTLLNDWRNKRSTIANSPSRLTVAILPFTNLNNGPGRSSFCAGLTEELVAQLGRLYPTKLTLIAHPLKRLPEAELANLQEIGRRSKARFILRGSVRRGAGRVRITVQLVRVKNQVLSWSEIYDRDISNPLVRQEEIAKNIACAVGQVECLRVRSTRPESGAHEGYLIGCHHLDKRTERGFRSAILYFEQVLKADRHHALAYAGMADALLLSGLYVGGAPRTVLSRAAEPANRALEEDGSLSEIHTTNAELAFHQGKWRESERAFQFAITLNPRHATAHCWYANLLSAMERHAEAATEIQTALVLDPASPVIRYQAGMLHYRRRQYTQAVEQLLKGLDLSEEFPILHWGLGICLERQSRYVDAACELRKAASLSFGNSYISASLAYVMARAGDVKGALRCAARLRAQSKSSYVCPYHLAKIYAALDDRSKAFHFLRRAYEGGSTWFKFLALDPQLDMLHKDPRFAALTTKIGSDGATGISHAPATPGSS
jgi:TolB-like protein/tetratricopeptide (TPR) repeat protein